MSVMLSRAAENIYWMGRYLERASNLCRMLQVAEQLTVEIRGLAPETAVEFWSEFTNVYRGSPAVTGDVDEIRMAGLHNWLLGQGNTLSVATSMHNARENARAIREYLTREVFEQINECWLHLDAGVRGEASPDVLLGQVQQAVFGIGGTIGRTLIRDEAWVFLDLGVMLERVYRVLMLLRHRLPPLMATPNDIDIPVHHALLRCVLRSAGSLENYRRVHGAGLTPRQVWSFLFFDSQSPHSVAFGVSNLEGDLGEIERGGVLTDAARQVGRLSSQLRYESQDLLGRHDFAAVCQGLASDIERIHESLTRLYFTV
ncbi:MAG: alpha-E domain-containing protein [Phycisphaerales bacterium]|jgi:uncharacterized alpha-E superfamily protein|nr:alpha-E domain-containing protein [Phycisphaerales bacterium]